MHMTRNNLSSKTRDLSVTRVFAARIELVWKAKLQHILSIEGARTAETRQQRITKAISRLREGRI